MRRLLLRTCSALVAAGLILQPFVVSSARAANGPRRAIVTGQPDPSIEAAPYYSDPAADPKLSNAELIDLLRKRVKYVFVLFQENRAYSGDLERPIRSIVNTQSGDPEHAPDLA